MNGQPSSPGHAAMTRPSPSRPFEPAWLAHPVWITGLMKTGTTLLLALLDGHPDLLAYPDEPSFERILFRRYVDGRHLALDWLFGTPNPLHYNAFVQDEWLAPLGFRPKGWKPVPTGAGLETVPTELLRQRVRLRGLSKEDERAAIDVPGYLTELERRLGELSEPDPRAVISFTMQAFYQAIRREEPSTPPRRWLFKQPLPTYRERSFERFFGLFPHGKCIVLTRDPRAYVASFLDYTLGRRTRTSLPSLMRWRLLAGRLPTLEADYLQFAALPARYGPDRVREVTYEALVTRTEPTLRELAAFLELPFLPVLTRPTKLGRPVRVPTATHVAADRVYDASIERWQTALRPSGVWLTEAATDRVFRELGPARGYRATTPAPLRRLLRAPVLLACAALRAVRPAVHVVRAP